MDISAFGVVSVAPTGLEQCTGASGGPWGSTYADKQFESYLTVRRQHRVGGAAKMNLRPRKGGQIDGEPLAMAVFLVCFCLASPQKSPSRLG